MMEALQQFWTAVYIFGFAAFILLTLIIIPLGFRDLLKLLKELHVERNEPPREE